MQALRAYQQSALYLTSIDEDDLTNIKQQKTIKDKYFDSKVAANPAPLSLDDIQVTKSIRTCESSINGQQGLTGVPLGYVHPHHKPKFGDNGSPFNSYDDEMIGCAAIYAQDNDCNEDSGPFHKVFLINSASVFVLLEKLFSKELLGQRPSIYQEERRTKGVVSPHQLLLWQ